MIPADERSYEDGEVDAGQSYFYVLDVVRPDGSAVKSFPVEIKIVQFQFALRGNYPNPFNPSTTIVYSIGSPGRVLVQIYDVQGRLVQTPVNAQKKAGEHTVMWNGESKDGSFVASGVYFVRLQSGGRMQARKIVLLK